MTSPRSNWHEITASQFPWEREAIDHVRGRFPANPPYEAWSNFEFLDASGRLYDVDLMLCGPKGIYIVEVKSWPGELSGDDHTLVWTDPEGRTRQRDHPLRLTNLKAKALKSLLERTSAARSFTRRLPYFSAAVFISDPQVRLALDERGRIGTYCRASDDAAGRAGVPDLVTSLVDVSPQEHAQLKPERRVDRPTAAMLREAMQQAGVRPSNRLRTVGGFRLGELLSEGPGFQDFAGQHETVASRRRRIRVYAAPQNAGDPRREQLRRAARREHELLEGLHHQGILRPQDYVEHDLGPALVLDAEPDWPSLDQWLADHGERLSLHDRLDLIRQIADAVRYAHDHGLVHRALSPGSVLVVPDVDEPQRIRIGDWRTGALTEADDPDGTIAGTRNVEALADPLSAPFLAPEAGSDPQADGVLLDVFSLGAIAYLVLAGRPAVERAEDLAAALRESDGLDLAAAVDGVGPDLRQLVRWSTAPTVTERMDSVDLFLMQLDEAEREASTQADAAQQADPLVAKPGERLGDRFVLERRLGTGSSAAALLVQDEQAGQPRVLKVALNPDREGALDDEAAVLSALRHPAIIELHDTVRLCGRTALVLQWASKGTLSARLRQDGPLSLEWLERFGTDLLEALRQLEREGYLHRDVKPENLGLVPVGKNNELHLVLLDFSLSRADPTAVRAGTPQYIDPFLVERGRVDPAADRYAATVTLHEMGTGRRPVWGDGKTAPELTTGPVGLATDGLDPSVRQPLAAFFMRALERDAAQRFDTADEMLAAWRAVFARVDVPAAPDIAVDDAERERLVDVADLHTPLAQLGLTTAQVAALERQNIVVVEDLVLLPPTQLNSMRGVGSRMRRDIARVAGALRRRFSDELIRRDVVAASQTTSTDDIELPDAVGLDAIVEQLLPAKARDSAQLRIQRTFLTLPLGELDGQEPSSGWPAADVVADQLGESITTVRAALDAGVRRWAKAPAITAVRRAIVDGLDGFDGVAGADELATRVLAMRGAIAQDRQTREALARAVTRAAIEVELARDEDSRITQRRLATKLLISRRDETAQALLDDVVALGIRADELGASDPPLAPDTVAAALREVSAVANDAGVRSARLLELASQASAGAAVSPRGELYPVGLGAARALALAQGALVGAAELTIDELRGRVSARYPRAQPLPDHQHALSTLLHEAEINLDWRTDPSRPGGGVFVPAALPLGLTALSSRTSLRTGSPLPLAAPDGSAAEADSFVTHLDAAQADGGLLALIAAPVLLRRARLRLLRERELTDVDLEAALLRHIRGICDDEKITWETISGADAAGPDGPQWGVFLALLDDAVTRLIEELLDTPGIVLLRGLGMLARYRRLDVLSRVAQGAVSRPIHGWWLLLPDAGGDGRPTIDGQAIEVVSSAQWARIPRSWARGIVHDREAA